MFVLFNREQSIIYEIKVSKMKNKNIFDAIRNIERKMNVCPETDCCDLRKYPMIDEDHFMYMESEFIENSSYLLLFPYYRNGEEPFIDIYIWDCTRISMPCRRFVICTGFRFAEEDEIEFEKYARSNDLRVYQDEMDLLYENIISFNPEYNYKKYTSEEAGMALLHLYYVSHHSGYLEILYKSGINYLAYDATEIPDCNYIGSSPEEIVGLPLKLLRILNQPGFSEYYTRKDALVKCLNTYYKYASYFKKRPSLLQWDYLYRIEGNDHLFNKTVYKRLSKYTDVIIVSLYIEFLKLQEKNKELSIGVPKAHELMDINEKLSILNLYNHNKVNKKIKTRKRASDLEFTGHKYSVVLPKEVNDIGKEALKQHNCLLSYVEPHIKGKTTIIFIRRTDEIEKPYVTAEVIGNKVEQFMGKFNLIPEADVFQFMEAYCAYKGISEFDPIELIEDNEYEDSIIVPDEIFEYMYSYSRRNSVCPRTKIKNRHEEVKAEKSDDVIQISMHDLYPEVMVTEEGGGSKQGDSLYGGSMGDMKYERKYKNEIDKFIWDNMVSLFDEKDERFSDCHDKLVSMVESLEICRHSFDMLWDIAEAYNITEVNHAILHLYKEYLTDDEIDMLKIIVSG